MKVKEEENISTEESNGIRKRYPAPSHLAVPTDLEPEDMREILAALDPVILGPSALSFKTKIFIWYLADTHFRD